MTFDELIQIIAAFVASLCFAVLFNIRGKKMIAAAFGGLLSWGVFILLKFITANEPIRYFAVAVLISFYAEIMARVLKTPTTTFHMTGLVPLIPGGSLYYTMKAALEGNPQGFFQKAIKTMELAVALALGIVITTAFTKIVVNLIMYIKQKKQTMQKS